jgi:MFS family permease
VEPEAASPPSTPGIETDLKLILAIQSLRAFAYGFGVVVMGIELAASGLSTGEVGLIFTAILAGMALASIVVGLIGERVGRRRLYTFLLSLMGLVGIVFAFTANLWLLILVSLTGTMSTDANESGPITSLEQAMIGQAPAQARIHVFGRYNAFAYLAGALGALGAAILGHGAAADQRWLLVFPLVAFPCAALALRLSRLVETGTSSRAGKPLDRSKNNVKKLSALFATDSFAGGFVVNSFIVFWFALEFHATTQQMGIVFFLGGILQAGSSILAARLGARFGLLNTMVFSHLPSNLLLIAIPFMPTFGSAVVLLLARFALSQMDVPTRQAYIAAMVDPEERTAAAAFTNTARYVTRPFGTLLGAFLLSNVATSAPFVAAGSIKCGYDLLIWRQFHKVELPG